MIVPGTPARLAVETLVDSRADPLGVLEENEIFFASSQPLTLRDGTTINHISGEVLVNQAAVALPTLIILHCRSTATPCDCRQIFKECVMTLLVLIMFSTENFRSLPSTRKSWPPTATSSSFRPKARAPLRASWPAVITMAIL